ncbi:gamma carbonic anhydrase family protein [Terrihabitans sp. B22-R8]|uniref:gamma carbonic anhydrase family protein n=1 Tax=Terrihabitans sp. B22-R8 TaxID=3425128 RepID=UPI00403C84E8
MPVHSLGNLHPQLPAEGTYWIAPDARLVGNVRLGEGATIWFGAVLRGDSELIDIGEACNVQDGCVLHVDPGFPLTMHPYSSLGHRAIVHGCTIGEGSLVGMGATILNGCVIGKGCLIGANALLTQGTIVPDHSLVVGAPGKVVRQLTEAEIARCRRTAEGYREKVARYHAEFGPAR